MLWWLSSIRIPKSNGSQAIKRWLRSVRIFTQGDFISITGPSGSGKSTLLHLLSGLDRPTSGDLAYDGREIYGLLDRELSAFRRRCIGFIFQQFHLLPVLTARENILMPLLLDKKRPDEAYLEQLTRLLGVEDRLSHLPHELSGGQQQRVAIARALIAKPEVIFADEPTGGVKLVVQQSQKNNVDVFLMVNTDFLDD
ncbi:ABC transporter ATP-binding protein [bacterium 1XD21-13]|nr:ABC transporter ATP-binding protein [bacterium 1XD21-13]